MAVTEFFKKYGMFKAGLATRGTFPYTGGYVQDRPGPLERDQYDVRIEDLYELDRDCNAVRRSIQALRDTIISDLEWHPVFGRKCRVCRERFGEDEEPEFCGECGAFTAEDDEYPPSEEGVVDTPEGVMFPPDHDWFEEPDQRVVEAFDTFFSRVDRNGNNLEKLLKMYEHHLEVVDDAFLVHLADYDVDREGNIVDWSTKEVFAADPTNFKMIRHPKLLTPGGRFWLCPIHRPIPDVAYLYGQDVKYRGDHQTDVYEHPSAYGSQQSFQEQGTVYEHPGECSECGRRLHEVWYVSVEPGTGGSTTGTPGAGGGNDQIVEYYLGPDPETGFPGEVIHESKYHPSYGYGHAPLVSVYNMARTLIEMERFMRTFYEEERMPRSALFIPTRNPDSISAMWNAAEDRNVSQDGHYVPKFTYDPGESNAVPQFMEFSKLPEEMQFEQVRDEFYRRIGSAFGVAPVLHGNVDAVGLQNQGPTQWQVTIQAARLGQKLYNTEILPQLLKMLRLKCPECGGDGRMGSVDECDLCEGQGTIQAEDWELELAPVDLEDEQTELMNESMRIQNAMSMMSIGFPPTGRNAETGEFEFPVEPQEDAMGMMGGMGGGGGFGGPPTQPPSMGGGMGQPGQRGGFTGGGQ